MNMKMRANIEFMFKHFTPPMFRRRIATTITEGGQFPVNSIEEIISAYERAERRDCRLNAFAFDPDNKLCQPPSLIFGDLDTRDPAELKKVLRRMREELIIAYPTVIDSGRGFHIIQPLDAYTFHKTPVPEWFLTAQAQKWDGFVQGATNEFLRFGEEFLTGKKADPCHAPTIKSCLLRPPGTINSKNDAEVKIVQEWDGQKPSIDLLLGTFYATKLQEYNAHIKEEREKLQRFSNSRNGKGKRCVSISTPLTLSANYYDSYIPPILETPLPDFRENMISLVIVPYLLNIKHLPEEQVYQITENWLEQCDTLSPMRFGYSLIWTKINNAKTFNYKPMGKVKLFAKILASSPEAHLILQTKLFVNNIPIKEVR